MILAACAFCLAGCHDPGDALTIATAWDAPQRARFAADLPPTTRIRWVLLAPSDDLRRLPRRVNSPDLILGGPASAYEALASEGLLEPASEGGPPWQSIQAVPAIGHWLEDAESVLDAGSWQDGYAELVSHGAKGKPLAEGIAVVRGGTNVMEAKDALKALASRLSPPPKSTRAPDARALLADLLNATLVESDEERTLAWSLLQSNTKPTPAARWMTEPPPWPPASVGKILEQGENAMPLLESLAGQIAPEADVRAWLVRSWLSPARQVDGSLLNELAAAVDGRLVKEPRFRSWLRSEWTAWARQRYRRVARQVKAGAAT